MAKRLKAPDHLRPQTAQWWLAVHKDYDLESHHSRLLTLAAEAFDRAEQAREMLDRDGICIPTGGGGLKAHPAAAIERDSRLAFARLLRELDLDFDGTQSPARPPALLSNRR